MTKQQVYGVSEAMIEAGMAELLGVINGNGSPPDKCVADIYLKMRQLDPVLAENERLRSALERVEPYVDAIVCYASTMDEHEPNRIAFDVRAALSRSERKDGTI